MGSLLWMSTSSVFVLLLRVVYRISRADANSKRYKKQHSKTVLALLESVTIIFLERG